jgi:hypothetical protein
MYNIDTAELTTMGGSSIFMVLIGLDYKSIAPLLLFRNDHCLQVSSLLLLCLNFLNDRCEIWFVLEPIQEIELVKTWYVRTSSGGVCSEAGRS